MPGGGRASSGSTSLREIQGGRSPASREIRGEEFCSTAEGGRGRNKSSRSRENATSKTIYIYPPCFASILHPVRVRGCGCLIEWTFRKAKSSGIRAGLTT